ncbi:MAG: hypothetical protein H7Z21_03875, partial [Hymenobacter sp.]|nr:hypothetical protein [Hymenobacter sp.]
MPDYSPPLIEWHFRGHCYTPLLLEYTLRQPTDYAGRPSGTVRITGVDLLLVGADLHGAAAYAVSDYMLDPFARRSSMVLVRKPNGQGGVFRRIELQDAGCTILHEQLQPGNTAGLPALTLRLRLSPAALAVDGTVIEAFSLLPWAAPPNGSGYQPLPQPWVKTVQLLRRLPDEGGQGGGLAAPGLVLQRFERAG